MTVMKIDLSQKFGPPQQFQFILFLVHVKTKPKKAGSTFVPAPSAV